MKERCGHVQKINDLCKEVELEAGSVVLTRQISKIPELTEEEEEEDEDEVVFEEPTPLSSSDIDPMLIQFAMEVKDLNVRFANTCQQAKQHYAALSRVLMASKEATIRRSKKKHSSSKDGENSHRRSRRSLYSDLEEHHGKKDKPVKVDSVEEDTLAPPNQQNISEATDSPNMEALLNLGQHSLDRRKGGPSIHEASILAADSLNPVTLERSASLSTGTACERPGSSRRSNNKAILRSIEYSNQQSRKKRRPKSAFTFKEDSQSEAIFLNEMQVRNEEYNSGYFRQRSAQADYLALRRSRAISQSNAQIDSPSSSETARSRFGSMSTLYPRDQSSFTSFGNSDPRSSLMVRKEMEQGQLLSRSFEASTNSDITNSTTQIPDFVLKQGFGVWNGVSGTENALSVSRTQSVSVDNLAQAKKKGWLARDSNPMHE